MVTIKDVAELAGVSDATVSRVLNGREYIKEQTRERVLKAVQELRYKPSRVARSLRINSSQIIGLIISDIQNPFFPGLVRAVEDVAHANNYALILANTDEDDEKETLNVDLMISERVAGVIITPTREHDCPVKKLINMDIPVVSVDRRVLDCKVDTVISNNIDTSCELVNYLIKCHHKNIGAIIGYSQVTTGRERLEGFIKALNKNNLPIDSELIKQGPPKESTGYKLANELLDLPNPPTALFAGNNLIALGAIQAIRKRGLSIPDDISIVSFDNREWTYLMQPKITVASQPTYAMGKKSAELLISRINNVDKDFEEIVLESKIHIRDSVKILEA